MEIKTLNASVFTNRRYIVETTIALALAMGKKVAVVSEYIGSNDVNLPAPFDAHAALWACPDNTKDARDHIKLIAKSGAYDVIIVEGWNLIWSVPSFGDEIESIVTTAHVLHVPTLSR